MTGTCELPSYLVLRFGNFIEYDVFEDYEG